MTVAEDRLVVVILVDALGWDIVERFGFASGLLPRRSALETVLGYSSAAIPSLLTGARPDAHGAWAMFRRAGGRSPFAFLRHAPRLPHALEWRARRLVRRLVDRRGAIRGYYDLYEIPVHLLARFEVGEAGDPYLPGELSRETLFDRLSSADVAYRMWYYRTPESDNMAALVDAVAGRERMLFLYTAELDALMHRVGTAADVVGERLRRYERFIERVLERAHNRGRETSVYVLSDHGMTDVHAEIDLWGGLERRGVRLGRDYLAFYDSTMARLWARSEVVETAARILEDAGRGRRVADAELNALGCYFPDGRYGTSILLADPGVMIVPSFMGSQRVAAMHGYDPRDGGSFGCFLTDDPTGALPGSILGVKDYLVGRVTS